MAMQGARTLTWNKRRARPRDSGTWIELRSRRIRELSHRGTDHAPARAEARAVHRSDSTMEPREVSRAGCLHKPDTVPQITAHDEQPEYHTCEESVPSVFNTKNRGCRLCQAARQAETQQEEDDQASTPNAPCNASAIAVAPPPFWAPSAITGGA